MRLWPNLAGAVDTPIKSQFHILRHRRRATDQHRWGLVMIRVIAYATMFAALAAAASPPDASTAQIERIVEVRDGRTSVWGVRVTLGTFTLRSTARLALIRVEEGKHSHELSSLMEKFVDETRRVLLIRFKPGMGDFGSGNTVGITIPAALLESPAGQPKEDRKLTIATDLDGTRP